MKPYLLSVELGPSIRCALVSLLTTCSEFHTLWEEAGSSHELVIAHDRSEQTNMGKSQCECIVWRTWQGLFKQLWVVVWATGLSLLALGNLYQICVVKDASLDMWVLSN